MMNEFGSQSMTKDIAPDEVMGSERSRCSTSTATKPGSRPRAPRRSERRLSMRYPAIAGRAWIAWGNDWYAGQDFRRSAAWILNISQDGMLLASDEPPPTDRVIWISLDEPGPSSWYPATVVAVDRGRTAGGGPFALRVRFPEGCPYPFFKRLVLGPNVLNDRG